MAGLFVLAPALVSSGSHGVATTAPNLQCPVAVKRWTPRRPCDFPLRLCVSLTCGPTTAPPASGWAPHQSVAPMAERRSPKPRVLGSSPSWLANSRTCHAQAPLRPRTAGLAHPRGCRRWHPGLLDEATFHRFGRGFDSRQVHHKAPCRITVLAMRPTLRRSMRALSHGPDRIRRGVCGVVESTRGDRRNRRKTSNANDPVFAQAQAA